MDFQFRPAGFDGNREMNPVRLAQLDLDSVSLLVFHNYQPIVSDMQATGGHASLNPVLIPGFDANVGIMCPEPKIGLAGQVVGLGPVVRMSGGWERDGGEYNSEQG
jgi:hypothetical protein